MLQMTHIKVWAEANVESYRWMLQYIQRFNFRYVHSNTILDYQGRVRSVYESSRAALDILTDLVGEEEEEEEEEE